MPRSGGGASSKHRHSVVFHACRLLDHPLARVMTTMRTFDSALPIDDALARLTAALVANNAAVLVAPPGAGKTTRVPLVLLDEPWAKDKKILVLEPRRLGAGAPPPRLASRDG